LIDLCDLCSAHSNGMLFQSSCFIQFCQCVTNQWLHAGQAYLIAALIKNYYRWWQLPGSAVQTPRPETDAADTTQEAAGESSQRKHRTAAERGHQHLMVVWRLADMFTNR